MTTVPPTATEMDAFLVSSESYYPQLANAFVRMFEPVYLGGNDLPAVYRAHAGTVMWVVGFTDNAGSKHYNILAFTGLGDGSDSDIESSSLVSDNANPGGEFMTSDPSGETSHYLGEFATGDVVNNSNNPQPLPYLYALKQAYGNILIRGYTIPPITFASFPPVSAAVTAWVNDTSNWATPG